MTRKMLGIALMMLLASMSSASDVKPFTGTCLASDGWFYGVDKVGFYCFTNNVDEYEYMYSMYV